MARSAFYHEVDDEGNRLTIVNGAPGQEPQPLAARAPGDLAAGDDRRRHRRPRPRRVRADQPRRVRPGRACRRHGRDGRRPRGRVPDAVQRVPPAGRRTREAAAALAQGYNDWIWDFAAQTDGRVHPVAILPLHSLAARAAVSSTGSRRRASRRSSSGPAFYATSAIEGHSMQRASSARAMADAMRQGLGGAEWSPRHFVENAPFRDAVAPHRRARARRVRAPVARDHRPRCHLERRVRRRVSASARRAAHDRGADRAHAGRRPVRHHGAVPRPARRPPQAAAGDRARGHELGAARAREVGDLPLALAAVRDGVRVPRARGGLGASAR